MDEKLKNHFSSVKEFMIFDDNETSYYIFYKPYDELNLSLIYDPNNGVILLTNGESNAVLERYLIKVRDGQTSLDSFCKTETESVEIIMNKSCL
ncbi:MAG TPA: hypothetical protein VFF15_05540 [Flavobacteriaceae bacterium]|nr:hypothetical protein [Flavobacteriaceae bacterium]